MNHSKRIGPSTFEIATRGQGRETRTGYVLGCYAVNAPAKGEFFWKLTHTPTGCSVNYYPPPDSKRAAFELLALADEGRLPAHTLADIAKCTTLGWGAGLR